MEAAEEQVLPQEQETPEVPQEQPQEQDTPPGFIDKDRWVEMGRDPGEWRDPQEFQERSEQFNSVLKQQRDELKAEIDTFKQDFHQYRQHQQQVTAQKERDAYERATRDYQQQLQSLREKKKEAIDMADSDLFLKVEDAERNLRPPQPPQQEQAPPQVPQEIQQWTVQNDWYNKDPELKQYADFLSATKYGPQVRTGQMSLGQALEGVSSETKKHFAGKFGNPRRGQPAPIDGGAPPRKTGKDYRDLPSEAKAACDRFVKKGIMSKEQYIKDYFGE